MTRTFQFPRSYDPSYSLLGRAIRAAVGDRLRGEALFIVGSTGLALLLLMTHYLGWALLKPVLAESPSGQLLFWGGQVASVLLWGAIGLVGFRPTVTIRCTPDVVELTQGARARTIRRAAIEEVRVVPARQVHRHYRRYAATTLFVGAHTDEMLLLRTARGPVVVAAPTAAVQDDLRAQLEAPTGAEAEAVPQT